MSGLPQTGQKKTPQAAIIVRLVWTASLNPWHLVEQGHLQAAPNCMQSSLNLLPVIIIEVI